MDGRIDVKTMSSKLGVVGVAAALLVVLAGCSSSPGETEPSASGGGVATVTVQSQVGGAVEVPVNPERVVVLDSTMVETLAALDVPPGVVAGVVKDGLQELTPQYAGEGSDQVADVAGAEWGQVDLEAIEALDPDLIIAGWRFSTEGIDGITELGAPVIELSPAMHNADSLRESTETLGEIFDKEDEAAELVADFDDAAGAAKSAIDGENGIVVMSTGGALFGSGPGAESRHGIFYDTFGLTINDALGQAVAEGEAHGAELSSEALLSANPDWIIVIDRDASFGAEGDFTPAEQVLDNELIAQTNAAKNGQIVYLDPVESYLGEGIVSYTHAAQKIADQAG